METWLIIAIVVVLALVLIGTILGIVYWMKRRAAGYSDAELTTLFKKAYVEAAAGRNLTDLDVLAISEVQKEDADGRSIYDARIKFLAGAEIGTTVDFRYTLKMVAAVAPATTGTLTIESTAVAPADSPLKAGDTK